MKLFVFKVNYIRETKFYNLTVILLFVIICLGIGNVELFSAAFIVFFKY